MIKKLISIKMKKVITLVFTIFMINGSFHTQDCTEISQPNFGSDSVQIKNCRQNLSLYSEYLKQKNWMDAARFWGKTQSFCPKYKPNLYDNGFYIYKKITQQKAKEKSPDKQAYVDTVYKIFDMWEENFGTCYKIQRKKASFIMSLDASKNFSLAYSLYEVVFLNSPEITSYSDVKYFTYAMKYMFKTGKIDCDKFLELYELLSKVCDNNIAMGNKAEKYKNVQVFVDNEVSPCASCDKLEEIYSEKYNANPEDMDLIRTIFGRLSDKKCVESSLYLSLLDKVLNDPNNPPSAKDLFNAATADHKRKNYSKAEERFNRAIESAGDDAELINKSYVYLYDIAFNKKSYKKAFSFAGKLSDQCEVNAKRASIIAASASTIAKTPLEKSSVYCYALSFAEKSCGKSSSSINSWKGQLLPKSDLIMLDINSGSEQKVPFWGATITLKTRD
ncbi:MAG: hypothetical protein CL846_03770 [Crocinitomicaceae bacterium]|nr:hypothetical protein [Crocinitomicaceae bacterium]|tara:strand:+ start:8950 stop:10287 length:1338 start_codon:yes stop_codon:yes gene_type:complete